MERLRRRHVQGDRRCHLRRRRQDPLRADLEQVRFHSAAVRRGRRADAQLHLDHPARCRPRPRPGRHQFYDGLAFMVARKSGVTELKGLDGATICMNQGATAEVDTRNYFTNHKMTYKPLAIENQEALNAAFFGSGPMRRHHRRTPRTSPPSARPQRRPPTTMSCWARSSSKSPLVARSHARTIRNTPPIVRWTLNAMITAEELGVTEANVDEMKAKGGEDVKRLLGMTPGTGKALGLADDWAYEGHQAGRQLFRNSFERNIGKNSRSACRRWRQCTVVEQGIPALRSADVEVDAPSPGRSSSRRPRTSGAQARRRWEWLWRASRQHRKKRILRIQILPGSASSACWCWRPCWCTRCSAPATSPPASASSPIPRAST